MRFNMKFVFILTVFIITLFITGCSQSQESEIEFHVYLDDIPDEYQLLSQNIRDDIEITVVLRRVSNDKKYHIKLTEENGYSNTIKLMPGKYFVNKYYEKNFELSQMKLRIDVESFQLTRDLTELPIYINDREDYIQALKNNQPSSEILSMDPYARKVQYKGEIIDLTSIPSLMSFVPIANESLEPSEIMIIPAEEDQQVSIIVQNQMDHNIPPEEGTLVGVIFYRNDVVFPKGVSLGLSISELCHADQGLMGTPNYFTETLIPMIWTVGYLNNTAVYLDKTTGDRVSLYMSNKLESITYEFEKFE